MTPSKHRLALPSLLLGLLVTTTASALPASDFVGSPSQFKPGKINAAAVWTDEAGVLHVRFSTDGSRQRYTGKVCAKDKVEALEPVEVEKDDTVWVGPEGKCVWFKFWTQGFVDGFSVRTSGSLVFFDFRHDQAALSADRIWIGKNSVHPEHNPFTLQGQ